MPLPTFRQYDPTAWLTADQISGNSSDMSFLQPSDMEQANQQALSSKIQGAYQQAAQSQAQTILNDRQTQFDMQNATNNPGAQQSGMGGQQVPSVGGGVPNEKTQRNWGGFSTDLVKAIGGDPSNRGLVGAMLTWFANEQPPDRPRAAYNPLNIQAGKGFLSDLMDGQTSGASADGAHQYNFRDWNSGVEAYKRFLNQKYYTGIVSAIRRGDPRGLLQAIQDSPWAANHYGGKLVGQYGAWEPNWNRWYNGQILQRV